MFLLKMVASSKPEYVCIARTVKLDSRGQDALAAQPKHRGCALFCYTKDFTLNYIIHIFFSFCVALPNPEKDALNTCKTETGTIK